jgi:septation ring formation regulator EzrA
MKKVIKLNETDINELIKRVLSEQKTQRYMFFSNLEQMKRQCEILLNMDHDMIEGILNDGHDWAQDHIAESKNNMDQVFDFLMNEMEGPDNVPANLDYVQSMMSEEKKKDNKLCARGIAAAKAKYDVWPSAYSSGFAVQVCRGTKAGLDGKKYCSGKYCKGKK